MPAGTKGSSAGFLSHAASDTRLRVVKSVMSFIIFPCKISLGCVRDVFRFAGLDDIFRKDSMIFMKILLCFEKFCRAVKVPE